MSRPTSNARERLEQLEQALGRLRREKAGLQQDKAGLQRDKAGLQQDKAGLQRDKERLERANERLRRERDQLRKALVLARRTGKRQAAPFSKGAPKRHPARPGRKPGRAYGPKAHRPIPEHVDEELEAPLPDGCPGCGGAIGHRRVEAQYQTEIIRTTYVTRFRVHVGACETCGQRVQGRHPRQTSDALGAAASQLGPDAVALAAVLNKDVGVSVGKTAAVLQQTFGLRVTPGGVSQAVARLGRKCAATYEDLKQRVQASASVTIDDTGWRVGGYSHWLFAAATADATVYAIEAGRGHADAAKLLGADFDGFLVRDGAAIYRKFAHAYQQSCTGHIINRCTRLIEQASGAAAAFPRQVKALLQQGLALRDRFASGEVSDHGLTVATGRLEATLDRLLGPRYRSDENRRLANHLDREFHYLFTYLKCPGLEATNYRAEQAIRPAAVIRKVWGGNRTDTGARTQAILMSVLRTSHQNEVDPLPLLADLLRSPHAYVLDVVPLRPAPN